MSQSNAETAQQSDSGASAVLRRAGVAFGLGLLGIVGFAVSAQLIPGLLPSIPGISRTVLIVASLVQPTILLGIAALVGAATAPAVGFRSHVIARVSGTSPSQSLSESLSTDARRAAPLGLVTGVVIVVLDVLFLAVVGTQSVESDPASLTAVLGSLPLRFLYGGITEEILLRWGLLSLIAWVGWRIAGRPERLSPRIAWTAIVVSAVLFGAGHLPLAAATTGLTPAIVTRVILLNSVGGIVYGWLYWRDSLEAAMIAHAASHVALASAVLVG
jgi:membrane protease YdiL (CAAX protease family)